MQVARPVGREAASRKYDILSALMAFALSQDKTRQRQVLRIMALITTRYNWLRDELSMGQGEIARLWSVDERTVKREMARLRAQGWLITKRQGARGRVSVYGLDLGRMLDETRPVWPNLGADFIARVEPGREAAPPGNVVPLHRSPPPALDGTLWSRVQARLHADDPATYGAWYHALHEVERTGAGLTLMAPTRFHASYVETHLHDRLLAALRREDPSLGGVTVLG